MRHAIQPSGIWWLNPAWLLLCACIAIALPAYLLPAAFYEEYWRTGKYFEGSAFALTLACAVCFAGGMQIASLLAGNYSAASEAGWRDGFPWKPIMLLFNGGFFLTLAGYAVWTAVAIQRGANLAALKEVVSGKQGAIFLFHQNYLATVGGVTTFTECGVATVILGCLLGTAWGFRTVRLQLAVLLALAIGRAYLNSERFAIIELVVPFVVCLLGLRYSGTQPQERSLTRRLLPFAPFGAVVVLLGIFTLFEYSRSWANYYAQTGQMNLLEFGVTRLLGYYVTSFNNGAFLLSDHVYLGAPFFTARMLFTFPGVSTFMHGSFPHLPFDSDETYLFFLSNRGVNPEFNSADGVLDPLLDFGIAGGLLYWMFIGMICGCLYKLFLRRRPAGILLYPFLYLGLLESPLALYWSEGKALPVYILLFFAAFICIVYNRVRVLSPAPALKGTPA
jgi:hypothetical protein